MWKPTALLLIALLLVACQREPDASLQGYVEGESLRIAATSAGRITALSVTRGQVVAAGAPLFALDGEREQAALAEAEQHLAAAESRLADLQKGRRPAELAVIRARLAQLQAEQSLARQQLGRQRQLREKGQNSEEQLDLAATQAARSAAAVQEQEQQLAVAGLAGRADALAATSADARSSEAQVTQARWQLAQKTLIAPAAGTVEEVYFHAGEAVAGGAPVLALLPPANRKLRFFVPQALLGGLKLGGAITAQCDGCGTAFTAKISFIASAAEFTPPVLYGREQRARLVFLVEALPDPAIASRLHPGQPLDIVLGP